MTEDDLPIRGMTTAEAELADEIYSAVMEWDRERPRTQQSTNFVVGMSELGFCSERTRRMLAGITPDLTDSLPAFFGTAIGDYVEQALQQQWPEAERQIQVSTTLHGDLGSFTLTGHPDLLLPWGVLDVKTSRGLEIAQRVGPSIQQQYQRHGYALGAWEAGHFGDLPLDEVRVANVWFDRAADDRECYVQMEPFSTEIMAQAAQWLDEVIYSYVHETDALKEPPRQMCEQVCGHFRTCRALDTDVEGLITDNETLAAVEMYREGLALEGEGKRLKDQAKPHLAGVNGSTGDWLIRWTYVNESLVPEYVRKGYSRINFSRLNKKGTP